MNRSRRLYRAYPAAGGLVRALAACVACSTLGAANGLTAQTPPPLRPLAYTRFTLPNGLVAILHEDHTTPIVSVQVWYHVGSKDDAPGHSGWAHLCEHLMSQGSRQVPDPQPFFYRSIGATSTHYAETSEDVTEYYITVPSNELETVLWAEADRMAEPFALADSDQVASVRAVVNQERHQNVENVPFGTSRESTIDALFPAGHPYHLNAAAAESDLARATPASLRAACLPYYVPNNAVLSVSGDLDSTATRAWIARYFGGIPRGAPVSHADPSARPLAGEQRLVLEDRRTTLPQLHFDWRGSAYGQQDRMALLALASALSLPRFGRLSKLLVTDRQLASNVIVDNYDLEAGGVFEIAVFARPGASLTSIETLVDSTLQSLATNPVTPEEIARFNAFNRVSAATSLQAQFARADTLAHDQVFTGDPTWYATQTNAARALTPADVQRVARSHLTPGRVVMSLVPAGKLEQISRPDRAYVNVTPPSVGAPGLVRP